MRSTFHPPVSSSLPTKEQHFEAPLHHREEVDGEFLEPRADAAAFLQRADGLLDDAATPVGMLVKDGSAVMPEFLVFLAGDQRLYAVYPKPILHSVLAVTLVTRQSLWSLTTPPQRLRDGDPIHDRLAARRLVRLAGSHFDRQRQAQTGANQVDLAAESASLAAQSVVFQLFRVPPAAFLSPGCGAAGPYRRTVDPPQIPVNRAFNNEPDVQGFENAIVSALSSPFGKMLLHGPNRSGSSRQGDPVRRINRFP